MAINITLNQNTRKLTDAAAPLPAAAGWGCAFPWIKMGLESFSIASVVTLRFVLAAAGFAALYGLGTIRYQPITRRDLPRFGLLVATGVFMYHFCLVTAETVIPASVASLIGQMAAVFALMLAAIHQPSVVTKRAVAGLLVDTTGAAMVITGGELPSGASLPAWAVATCFGAPLALAIFTTAAKPLVQRYGAPNLTGHVMLTGGTLLAASIPFRPEMIDEMATASATAWGAALALGLVSTLMAYTLWYRALESRPAEKLTMYTYLVPVFSVAVAAAFLHEHITVLMALGGIAVIAGIATANKKRPSPAPTRAPAQAQRG
jgi:drug/metabolite transporter (DMT)-like permease